eukprot:4287773-Amphidinium_carterae.1
MTPESKCVLQELASQGDTLAMNLLRVRASEIPRLLVLNTDQASQMRACAAFLKHCNIFVISQGDVFHRHWNDLVGACKDAGLYTGMILSTVYLNLGAGPWGSAAWWKEP